MMRDRFGQDFERGQTVAITTSELPVINGVVLAVEEKVVVEGNAQAPPMQKLRIEISLEVPIAPIPIHMGNVIISKKELVKEKKVLSIH